jgi:Uncharacterized protein conserved in bacteria (DUF2188)
MSENVRTNNRPRAVQGASAEDWLGSNGDPDVLLSVPDLGVDKIHLQMESLQADVDLRVRVLSDVVDLNVGASVNLGQVEIDIENLRVQAMLKVKLDKVAEIVDRVMTAIDNNPELITSLTSRVGRATEALAQETGEGVHEIGRQQGRSPGSAREIEGAREAEYDGTTAPEHIVVETVWEERQWWNRIDDEWRGPFDTKQEAADEGRELAEGKQGEHVVYTQAGKVSSRHNYAGWAAVPDTTR